MWIRLINEAWTPEVKKIASYPSFHSKFFLAHNVFLSFSYEFTMKINKSHSWFETSTFAWIYMYIQVRMYIFVMFHTLTFYTLTKGARTWNYVYGDTVTEHTRVVRSPKHGADQFCAASWDVAYNAASVTARLRLASCRFRAIAATCACWKPSSREGKRRYAASCINKRTLALSDNKRRENILNMKNIVVCNL